MGSSSWTCPSGSLRWYHYADGRCVLQQLMERDGYVPTWMDVPEARAPHADIVAKRKETQSDQRYERRASRIAQAVFATGRDGEFPVHRIAFKHKPNDSEERELGGLGLTALQRVIEQSIRGFKDVE